MVLGVLGDIRRGEEERREAAGVVAQVLSPWIDGNTNIQEIDSALTDIVISLKGWWRDNYFYPGGRRLVSCWLFLPPLDSHRHTAPWTGTARQF